MGWWFRLIRSDQQAEVTKLCDGLATFGAGWLAGRLYLAVLVSQNVLLRPNWRGGRVKRSMASVKGKGCEGLT